MQVKIIVKTPKGQAIATEKKIRNFLLGINKKGILKLKHTAMMLMTLSFGRSQQMSEPS
jgi:hypothetical protein